MNRAILGERIREERKRKSLTLEKLEELAGVSAVYLSEVERGNKTPSLATLIKIVNILDVSIDSLLCYEVNQAKPHVFNEITERVKDLPPAQLKVVADVVGVMADNFQRI